MVMKPEPLAAAVAHARKQTDNPRVLMMTPQGRPFDQAYAEDLTRESALVFICGRYEGIDERVCLNYVDDEVSLGDFIMTGGEIGTMAVMDAVIRLIPGVLGDPESAVCESFSSDLLEHPHYTRPPVFDGAETPEILLSGNHGKIDDWRFEASVIRTFLKRPDLMAERSLSQKEIQVLEKWSHRVEAILAAQGQRADVPNKT